MGLFLNMFPRSQESRTESAEADRKVPRAPAGLRERGATSRLPAPNGQQVEYSRKVLLDHLLQHLYMQAIQFLLWGDARISESTAYPQQKKAGSI